ACGNSTVKACGNSTVEAYDNSTVKAYDNSTVEAYGNSYINDATGKCTQPDACAIVRDYHNRKIYIKKGAFEIIEVE
ncbi:hypothetical protein, partial [Bacteroides heparinolyticus]|uniref:hypothetical protein n=1 Tax=Prevotella heparinolytica TaxID=28113 RepID=UPI0023F35909